MIKKLFGGKKTETKSKEPLKPETPPSIVTGSKSSTPSVQAWLPFYDVNMNFIWRRDNHLVTAVEIEPINIFLLSEEEQKRKIKMLFEVINSLDVHWSAICIQRPVDLDKYIGKQEEMRNAETHHMRRRILDSSIRNASQVASSGEAMDLQFYILISGELKNKKQILDMQQLLNKATELAESLTSAELVSQVCSDHELRELLFNYLNPLQSAYERAPLDSGPYLPPQLSMEVNYG
jgi:hypothetical protein